MTTDNDKPLADRECKACKDGVPPLKGDELDEMMEKLGGGWQVVDEHHLAKSYKFDDFRGALDFVNRVGELAEDVGHHPDIHLAYGKVRITIWTHAIGGLSETDFVFAARADGLRDA